MGEWKGERRGEWRKGEEKEENGSPRVNNTAMSAILKNTMIAELISLVGAATQTFAPGGKLPRAATVIFTSLNTRRHHFHHSSHHSVARPLNTHNSHVSQSLLYRRLLTLYPSV